MSWALFREVHLKVILAVLVVIASMLLLQSGLNQLKFRSLVADATASSLQVIASGVETAVQRAEQVGLAIEEMTGLEDLMMREQERHRGVTLVMVVSPVGTPLVSVGADALPEEHRDAVLRRVLGSGERQSSLDVGDTLFVGRVLYDSSNLPMGAVILATETNGFAQVARETVDRLNLMYLAIFLLVAILLIPFIFLRFKAIGPVYRLLKERNLSDPIDRNARRHPHAAYVAGMIATGNEAFAAAEAEVTEMERSPGDMTQASANRQDT